MRDNICYLVDVTNGNTGEGDFLQAGAGRVNGDVNFAADEVLGDDADWANCHYCKQQLVREGVKTNQKSLDFFQGFGLIFLHFWMN